MYGFRDASGKWAIPPFFKEAYSFSEGLAAVKMSNQAAVYNKDGKVIAALANHSYRMLDVPKDRLNTSASSNEQRYLYLAADGGRTIIDGFAKTISPRVDTITEFYGQAYTTAGQGGLIGLIDYDGNWLIHPRFKQARVIERRWQCDKAETEKDRYCASREAQLMVQDEEGYGFVDLAGKWLSPPRQGYASIDELDNVPLFKIDDNTYAMVTRNGEWLQSNKQAMWLYIKSQINLAKPPSVISPTKRINGLVIERFVNGIAVANRSQSYDYVDSEGETIIAQRFTDAKSFSEGLAAVEIDNLWGYINAKGEIVIRPRYKKAESFHDGLAVVKSTESALYGVIDTGGNSVVPASYIKILAFNNGYSAVLTKNKEWFLLNRTGEIGTTAYKYLKPLVTAHADLIRVTNTANKDRLLTYSGEERSPEASDISMLAYPFALLIDNKDKSERSFTLIFWNIESQKVEWVENISESKE